MPDNNESVSYEVSEGVAKLTLNRPHVLNSFNRVMSRRLQELLQTAGEDESIRCLLLTGAGRAFCAGQDLAEATPSDGAPPPDVGSIVRQTYNPIIRGLREIEKPVVCAVNGIAAGAGANIALACDLVLASEDASFIQAFSKIGLVPDSGGTFLLPRMVGMAEATALMFLGEKLPALRALELGLIYAVCAHEELESESVSLARQLAQMPTRALALTKQALNASFQNSLQEQLELEAELQSQASETEDFREGIEAFLAKRKPRFKGK